MDSYSQLVSTIIKHQEIIIGPIALEQAKKVEGLDVTNLDNVQIKGDEKEILNNLVGQYFKLFGNASVEVCKEALIDSKLEIPKEKLPEILQ
jgi:hypothetical protein